MPWVVNALLTLNCPSRSQVSPSFNFFSLFRFGDHAWSQSAMAKIRTNAFASTRFVTDAEAETKSPAVAVSPPLEPFISDAEIDTAAFDALTVSARAADAQASPIRLAVTTSASRRRFVPSMKLPFRLNRSGVDSRPNPGDSQRNSPFWVSETPLYGGDRVRTSPRGCRPRSSLAFLGRSIFTNTSNSWFGVVFSSCR